MGYKEDKCLSLALKIKDNFKKLGKKINLIQGSIKKETDEDDEINAAVVKIEGDFNEIEEKPSLELSDSFDKSDYVFISTTQDTEITEELSLTLTASGFCRHCGRCFPDESRHQKFVKEFTKKRFYCRDHVSCNEKFTRHELVQHCIDTGIRVSDIQEFFRKARNRNANTKNLLKGEPCEICCDMFTFKDKLEEHYNIHEDQYFCEICRDGFKKIMDYVCHMQGHNGDKKYECPICNLRKEKMCDMRMHIFQTHEQFKRFMCKVCGKRFAFYNFYYEHVKYFHKGEKRFSCDVCGKKFMYSWYLNSHMKTNHKSTTKSFTAKASPDKPLLIQPRFVCDICGNGFKYRKTLNNHLEVHQGYKKHKCSYCDKKFFKISSKREHERVHTGDKPYKCIFCSKGFRLRSSLATHLQNHTGEHPHVCQFCNRGFASKAALVNHMKNCEGRNELDEEQFFND